MVGAQFCVRTFPAFGGRTYQPSVDRQIRSSLNYSSSLSSCLFCCSSFRFLFQFDHGRKSRRSQILVSCKNSSRSTGDKSNGPVDPDHEYAEAFVLLSETISHYRMHMQGFQEEIMWPSSTQVFPSILQARESRSDVGSVGPAFLRHFQSPTIFLKISCDGDFLLPILVGEYAVEKLIDSTSEDESWDCCPNQFQLVRNLAETLGYKVTMVKITERVVNTYFARIFFCKPGETDILSVDARPSDAINVAKRCRVPIYVRKQIVLTDGIRIGYGMGRKSVYDASLDSAANGPDMVAEELDLVMNMNLAVKEERYSDAAIWRDKLIKFRESRRGL